MLNRILLTCIFAALTVNVGQALDHSTSKIVIPVGKTSAADGKQMFTNYCAPCHGTDGRGHGSASGALKVSPTDLSTLTSTNNGKFPVTHLLSVLRFGLDHPSANGQMPVWGKVFAHMEPLSEVSVQQRTTNVIEYVRGLQVR